MTEAPPTRSSRYVSGLLRHRGLLIGVWLLMVAASTTIYLTRFRIDNSVAIWFLEDDPGMTDYRQSLETFGETEWTYLWLQTEAVFAPKFLRDLQDLAAQLKKIEHVHRTVAITDAQGAELDGNGQWQNSAYYPAPAGTLPSAAQVTAFRKNLDRNSRFREALLPEQDDRFTLIAIENDNLIRETAPYRIRLIDRVRKLVASYPSIQDAGLVGTTVVNAELNRAARRDMFVYYTLIAAFVLLVGSLVLRHRRDLAVLVAVLLGTILPVMGSAAAMGLAFNLMTVMLPTLLVTVGVSYLLHFLNEFHLEHHPGTAPGPALGRTIARLWKPGLWTSATTAIGFLSLTVSEVAPIRQVGWLGAGGIVLAWLTTLTVTPALLSILWPSGSRGKPARRTRLEISRPLLIQAMRPRPAVVGAFAVMIVAGAAGLPRLRADTNYIKFFKAGNEVRADYEQLRELGLPQSSLPLTITLPEGTRFTDPVRHHQQLAFESALLALPEVGRIESLDRLVSQTQQSLPGEAVDDDRALVGLLREAESGSTLDPGEFLARDGKMLRLQILTDYMGTDALLAFRTKIETVVRDTLPDHFGVTLTGTNLLWANMDAQVIRTQLLSIALTSLAVLVILPLVFRSLLLGLLGFVVSFVPILFTLGIMAWMNLPVNIATCLLGGVVIGISVDDTIYFLSRIRNSLDQDQSLHHAIRGAIRSTGRAMVMTSVVLTGGFLTMAASDFLPSVYFGLFFAASIVVALLADLLLLPSLLRRCERGL